MAVTAVVSLLAAGAALTVAPSASADTQGPIDFESYALGTVNGQDGWTSTGPFDQGIADNSAFPEAPASFGAQSFRISDAVTSGSFGNQTFSKATVDAAGETTADAAGFPTGTRRARFTTSFDFASVTPDDEQPGLHTSISPDRGDGARMSYVRVEDTASGWDLYFSDYVDVAPLGSDGDLDDGCGAGDGFTDTLIASAVSRTPHTLQIVMELVEGPHNDVVQVLLDGEVLTTGTSWEDYFRYCGESGGGTGGPLADQSRIVRNVLIRAAGTASPGNAGAGFLFDDFVVSTVDPTLNLTSICTYSGGPYDGQHLWRVTSTYLADKPYTSQSPFAAAPVARTATPGKSWFLGVQDTTKISYSNASGPQQVTKAANGNTCTDPAATITTPPDGASYPVNAVVAADFACTGTELVSCVGDVADGDPIDTATTGGKTFEVTATAWDGGTATATNDYTVVNPPSTKNACTFVPAPNTVTSAQISWYPANPGAMSGLEVACTFRNDTGGSMVSPSFTIHDSEVVSYHNGAAKRVTAGAAAVSGATSVQLSVAGNGIVGLPVAPAPMNRVISGPGIGPRTFVTSMTGGGLATLSRPTTGAVPNGSALKIENAIARSVDDAASSGVDLLDSVQANFTAADVGLSVTGTGVPAGTTVDAFISASQVQLSNPWPGGGLTDPTVSLGGTLLTSTARQITGVTTTSAVRLQSPTGLGSFTTSDVGLPVSGTCTQLTADTGDDTVIPADTVITGTPSPQNADTTGGLVAGWSGCTIVVGAPNANAPADGEVIAAKGVQANLNPDVITGHDICANDSPDGVALTGRWYNPGSFQGLGVTNAQPGPTSAAPAALATKAIGQIYFSTSTASFSAFVLERRGLTASDPNTEVHYDIVFPFSPIPLAMCPSTVTSPGLGFVLDIEATTLSQSTLPPGTGRPGTGQVRNVQTTASGGYTTTVHVDSQGIAAFTPSSSFQRVCVYPAGTPSPINFQCGAG